MPYGAVAVSPSMTVMSSRVDAELVIRAIWLHAVT